MNEGLRKYLWDFGRYSQKEQLEETYILDSCIWYLEVMGMGWKFSLRYTCWPCFGILFVISPILNCNLHF